MERTAHVARHLAAAVAPTRVEDLRTPCCLVNLEVARANAARMLQRAAALGCRLRPHVKTHKTIEGALLQTGGARRGITVSTLAEAAFFAEAGFEDILYAVPITPDKLPEAAALTAALRGTLHITVIGTLGSPGHPGRLVYQLGLRTPQGSGTRGMGPPRNVFTKK